MFEEQCAVVNKSLKITDLYTISSSRAGRSMLSLRFLGLYLRILSTLAMLPLSDRRLGDPSSDHEVPGHDYSAQLMTDAVNNVLDI